MRTIRMLVVAALAMLLLAAVAQALVPKAGLWVLGTGEGGGSLTLKGSTIAKKALSPSRFKCKVRAEIPKAIKVGSDGRFSYSGGLSALHGAGGKIVFKGRFSSASKVSGSSVITKGSCTEKVSWKGAPQAASSPVSPGVNLPPTGSG